MKPVNEQFDQLPDDQTLDALLAQARWSEPSEDSLRHLRRIALHRPSFSLMRIASPSMAAAAVLVIALGTIWLVINRHEPVETAVIPQPPPTPVQTIVARNATPAEQAILYSLERPPRKRRPATPAPQQPLQSASPAELAHRLHECFDYTTRQTLLAAILHNRSAQAVEVYLNLIDDPATSNEALAGLENVSPFVIDELFRRLDDSLVSRRMAAARALGRLDGPVITERLAMMVQRNENRREALAALVSSEGDDATDFISRARKQPSLASEIRVIQSELNKPS